MQLVPDCPTASRVASVASVKAKRVVELYELCLPYPAPRTHPSPKMASL